MLVARPSLDPLTRARLLRDGAMRPVGLSHLIAGDLPDDAGVRASTLRGVVAAHTTLSGLVGAWVLTAHAAALVPEVRLLGKRGLHRLAPVADSPWLRSFHAGEAATEAARLVGGVRVAPLPRCLADALRWDRAEAAIPAVIALCGDEGGGALASRVGELVGATSGRGAAAGRQRSAWSAVVAHLRVASLRAGAG